MRRSNRLMRLLLLTTVLMTVLALAACQSGNPPEAQEVQEPAIAEPTEEPSPEESSPENAAPQAAVDDSSGRRGAWVDEIVAVEEPSSAAAVTRLGVGEIDVYAVGLTEVDVFATIQSSSDLGYIQSFGSSTELTFNPAGPVFEGTGKLNPFAVPRIREAMNWLVDRNYVAQEVYGGLAVPRFTALTTAFPDYARILQTAREIEGLYAHDPQRAEAIITEEMEALGAERVDGTWMYEGEAVQLIILIRTEDERLGVGDYVASLLEDIGFSVERSYRTAAEASPIWIQGDPNDGEFHIYTGGWVTTLVSRDQSTNFNFFYTARGLASPLWQAYTPAPEFDEIADQLAQRDFSSLEERQSLYAQALTLSMQDSVRIFLVDRLSVSPFRSEISVAGDLGGGINGSRIWALTLRRNGEEGGAIQLATQSILPNPWNPLDGSSWVYDQMLIRATGDDGSLPDPYTGLYRPQRLERAEVFIQEGLPVVQNLDWAQLEFVDGIEVPDDAWIDWDPVAQRFITVAEKHPEGLTALRKSVAYFPPNYDGLTWHDGSPFSAADIVMTLILSFDRGKADSAIYDEAQVPDLETFLTHFRGARIVQREPMIVEYYSNLYTLDAEENVTDLFPYYGYGPGSWHALGMGIHAEAAGELAFSDPKADALEVEWMNMISGPSLETLAQHLATVAADGWIPYAPTLSEWITPDEAAQRWENLQAWYEEKGHYWVGVGPFYLQEAFPVEGTVVLRRNENYPDLASKWSGYGTPQIPDVEVDGPGRVTGGAEVIFDVYVTTPAGDDYAAAEIDQVQYLLFNAVGELAFAGDAAAVGDGLWEIVLSAEQTAQLEAGANRLEVGVVSKLVSIPGFSVLEFVSVP